MLNLKILRLRSSYLLISSLFFNLVDSLRIWIIFSCALALWSLILNINLLLNLIIFCFLQLPLSIDCVKIYLLLHEYSRLEVLKNGSLFFKRLWWNIDWWILACNYTFYWLEEFYCASSIWLIFNLFCDEISFDY